MSLNADMSISFWVNTDKGQEQAIDLSAKNCQFSFDVEYQSDANNLFNQITDITFGEIQVDFSALGQQFNLNKEKPHFGLQIKLIQKYLNDIKPAAIIQLNRYLATQSYSLPESMFFGIFDFKLTKASFTFHTGFLGMNFDPECKTPIYDDTSEPRFIYQAFTPQNPKPIDAT